MDGHYDQCRFSETGNSGDCRCEIERYKRAVGITMGILILQLIAVWFTNNLALRADTFHASSDLFVNVASLVIACVCLRITKRKEGFIRGLFACLGTLLLFIGGLHVLSEAQERLVNPAVFIVWPVILVATAGAAGNYLVHKILSAAPEKHRSSTHEVLSAHVLSDFFCSLAVIISATVIFFSGWTKADPYISILLAGYIFFLSGRLFSKFLHETSRYKLLSFILVCVGGLSLGQYSVITGTLLFLSGFCFGTKKHEECCH
ncbi:MAG: cation transporter [Candidatus Falkowbacteria bacterium]